MADQCSLCQGPSQSSSEYCSLHLAALANLENAFAAWRKSYGGNLSEEDYFAMLEKLSETGAAVKAVIRHSREKRAET